MSGREQDQEVDELEARDGEVAGPASEAERARGDADDVLELETDEELSAEHDKGAAEDPGEGSAAAPADGIATDAGSTGQGSGAAGDEHGDADRPLDATDAPPLHTILEAVLFAAAEPVPIARLVKLLGAWPRATVSAALDQLRESLLREGRGIRLAETAGGLQLRSAAECAPWVRHFFAEKPPRLSRAVLETLAIVAYRQPATRGEVEAVRGVNCDAVLGALLTRQLIQVVGRRQSPGRPVEYGTTAGFLELFSLRDLDELPELPEPAALARLIEEAEVNAEQAEGGDADLDGENSEDLEPGGDRLAPGSGGPDPGGEGQAEREGDPGAGDEGGPEQGPHHR